MLTDAELAAMQAVQESTMTQTATITRITRVPDGMGGWTEVTASTDVDCRLAPSNNMAQAAIFAGQLRERVPWRCTLPSGTDIIDSDRVTVDGVDFEVVGILGPYGFETALVVILAERD